MRSGHHAAVVFDYLAGGEVVLITGKQGRVDAERVGETESAAASMAVAYPRWRAEGRIWIPYRTGAGSYWIGGG